MAFFGDLTFGGLLGGLGDFASGAGGIASAFQKAPKQPASTRTPFTGTVQAPAYTFGGGTLQRRNDDFLTGQRRIRSLTGGLLERTQPGFGQLTESGVAAIRNRAAQASGTMRSQLARRGLSGASFADDQLQGVASEYQQLENEFRAQAFQQEMAASIELINQEQNSLLAQIGAELGELELGTDFLSEVNQLASTQAQLEARAKQDELLAKYGQVGLPSPQGPVGATQGPVDFAGNPIRPPVPPVLPTLPPIGDPGRPPTTPVKGNGSPSYSAAGQAQRAAANAPKKPNPNAGGAGKK